MKQLLFILLPISAMLFLSCNRQTTYNGKTINPILGDISFVDKFGYEPTEMTDEDLRIKTHFEYVENLLRQKDISDLTPELQEKRKHILDLLHDYRIAGIFPRNYERIENRLPCFIDKDGKICGVGYLIEQTAGRQIAEEINSRNKYDRILAMNNKSVDNWISESGLTKEECAMIQPTYGPVPTFNYNYISPAYGVSSAILCGINLSMITMNSIQISTKRKNKVIPGISMFTGATSILIGAGTLPKERSYSTAYGHTNESKKYLSFINIGLGSATMILSFCNIITNRHKNEKSIAWNVYSFRGRDNRNGLALSLTKKL